MRYVLFIFLALILTGCTSTQIKNGTRPEKKQAGQTWDEALAHQDIRIRHKPNAELLIQFTELLVEGDFHQMKFWIENHQEQVQFMYRSNPKLSQLMAMAEGLALVAHENRSSCKKQKEALLAFKKEMNKTKVLRHKDEKCMKRSKEEGICRQLFEKKFDRVLLDLCLRERDKCNKKEYISPKVGVSILKDAEGIIRHYGQSSLRCTPD